MFSKSGDVINDYRLIHQMCSSPKTTLVFSAQNLKTNLFVAIKIFDVTKANMQTHFLHEVTILNKIHHPNVVQIIDSGQDQKIAYIIMEFLEGVPLNRITPKNKGLPFQTIWPFVKQIGEGLTAIHQAKVAHLDLKPSNILLTHQDNKNPLIKIIDFDIAENIDETRRPHCQVPWGTPSYTAPERILENSHPDIRSDIYAFGAVIAFLLTGQQPFAGKNPEQILAKQLNQLPDVMTQNYLGESKILQTIICKAMQKDPHQRFQSIPEMIEVLECL